MNVLRRAKVFLLAVKQGINSIVCNKNKINLLYYQIRNWGDAINPYFASRLGGVGINSIDIDAYEMCRVFLKKKKKYLGIGSIVEHADEYTEIWGSGIMSPKLLNFRPVKVHAVRGRLTAEVLRKSNIDCPDIFGDPVLLFPRIYFPLVSKKYTLGIVCHVVDTNSKVLTAMKHNKNVTIISMRDTTPQLIDRVCECEYIASTSLHGLIIGDAYNIPTVWVEMSKKIAGGGFKFLDYYSSIHAKISSPLLVGENTCITEIIENCSLKDMNINLDLLYKACPYVSVGRHDS